MLFSPSAESENTYNFGCQSHFSPAIPFSVIACSTSFKIVLLRPILRDGAIYLQTGPKGMLR